MSLIEHLQTIRACRTQPEYPLWVVLLLVVMGTMSGCTGYRPLANFVARYQTELLSLLDLPQQRLPSLSTLRRIMVRVNFESFTQAFNAWAHEPFAPTPGEPLATDGKSIKASVRDYDQSYQDFVSVVSAFSVTQGVVVGLETMRNQQTSEIQTVEVLLETLQLKGVCFSLDALHTQKTVAPSIDSGNDSLMTVKGNQPKRFEQLQAQFEHLPTLSVDRQMEQTRDRQTQRTVRVLDCVGTLAPQWVGVQRIIRVERVGTRANQPFSETMFYISSLTLDAAGFAQRIRQHWHIENRLHWVKDVVLQEELAPLCDGNAPVNFAIVRTIALNLFRQHGFDSITQGLHRLAHDIPTLFSFFQ